MRPICFLQWGCEEAGIYANSVKRNVGTLVKQGKIEVADPVKCGIDVGKAVHTILSKSQDTLRNNYGKLDIITKTCADAERDIREFEAAIQFAEWDKLCEGLVAKHMDV